MTTWLPWSLPLGVLAGVLGDRAENGVVHRLVGKRRLRLPLAGHGCDLLLFGVLGEGVLWLQGLEGWEWLLPLD